MPPTRSRAVPPAGSIGLLLLALVPALAGCAGQRLSDADLERQTECGAQADRQFDKQNRYLLSEQDQTGTPYSSHGIPGDTTSGLSDLYRRDNAVQDCIHDGEPVPAAPEH